LQFVPDGCARASLVFVRVLRTLIGSIAQSLRKLQIRLRLYFFFWKNSKFFLFFSVFRVVEKIGRFQYNVYLL